jgi:hypothetical protein
VTESEVAEDGDGDDDGGGGGGETCGIYGYCGAKGAVREGELPAWRHHSGSQARARSLRLCPWERHPLLGEGLPPRRSVCCGRAETGLMAEDESEQGL